MRPWVAITVVVVALAMGIAIGWGARGPTSAPPTSTQSSATPSAPSIEPSVPDSAAPGPDSRSEEEQNPTADELLEQLPSLPVPVGPASGYDRAQFGQAWFDADRNGCDTRNDILRRDLSELVLKADTNGCKVLRGTFIDPYSGESMQFISGVTTSVEVQIDHLVPLAWAWGNGASAWSLELRQQFANDPINLLAVQGALNQQKSAQGPAQWLPPNREFHCDYARGFATVLVEYQLGVPGNDRVALLNILERC